MLTHLSTALLAFVVGHWFYAAVSVGFGLYGVKILPRLMDSAFEDHDRRFPEFPIND